jgi:ssDNA-binding Zn-finger/Zn-ribbon topoisomerase 1
MSLDLFMNDTCPKCRKPIKLAAIESHPNSRELAVHRFECPSCGRMTTKILYRQPTLRPPDLRVANASAP